MTQRKRTKVFISHATHEDDYFATWLTVRLRALGYDAWVDQKDLTVGDSFATVIQPLIQEEAIRFVAVNSQSYINKSGDQNTGVSKELNCASCVRDVERFIAPIRCDDVPFEKFPYHYNGWKAIDFKGNWQSGLVELVGEFEKDGIPRSRTPLPSELTWYNSIANVNATTNDSEEYYSNCLSFDLPSCIWIHQPEIFQDTAAYALPFPKILEAKRIITFAGRKDVEKHFQTASSHEVSIETMLTSVNHTTTDGFVLKEPRKKLVWLLNRVFEDHLRKHELKAYVRRKKSRPLFYFPHNSESLKFVSLKSLKRRGRALTGKVTRTVKGKRQTMHWHFALKGEFALEPIPHFQVFYTLVFTDHSYRRFDNDMQGPIRKSIASGWYNRKWFETLLAALVSVSNQTDKTRMDMTIGIDKTLTISTIPVKGTCSKGYREPENDS